MKVGGIACTVPQEVHYNKKYNTVPQMLVVQGMHLQFVIAIGGNKKKTKKRVLRCNRKHALN